MLNSCEVQPQARMGLFRSYVRLLGMIHTDLNMYGPVHESTGPSSIARLGTREDLLSFNFGTQAGSGGMKHFAITHLLPGSAVDSSMSTPDLTAL
jgi:hypothetical protein